MKVRTTTTSGVLTTLLCSLFLFNCSEQSKPPIGDTGITPVPLPSIVPGFTFPTDSVTINSWMSDPAFSGSYDSISIYNHAWGIWAGLTDTTNQYYGGDQLLVFETWLGLGEVQDLIEANLSACTPGQARQARTALTRPKQFEHAARFAGGALKEAGNNFSQWVTVSYSPDAACYATENQIFRQSVINRYYQAGGLGQIPDFPNTAITLKPTYLVFHDTSALLRMPVWLDAPNPPDSILVDNFPYCVYIDTRNTQVPGKALVPVLQSETDTTAIANATCNLTDFIYFTVDEQMARLMNQNDSIQGVQASAGELAVLVGMHVTSKETSNWTWQSFYWTPNPANPGTPSSELAAVTQPAQLVGAAAHYAANAAYTMLTPNGAGNANPQAKAMFGYNPYLEGGFGPGTFKLQNAFDPGFQYGMQTNCMSCHALAVPSPAGQYTTDQFIDLSDGYFNGQVKIDFAWSIQTGLIADTVAYWNFPKP